MQTIEKLGQIAAVKECQGDVSRSLVPMPNLTTNCEGKIIVLESSGLTLVAPAISPNLVTPREIFTAKGIIVPSRA